MKIIDCTLREGFQTLDFNFQEEALDNFALKLASTGISMIECSHPLISTSYANFLKSVVNLQLPIPVLTHCRANKKDIDAALKCGVEWVGIFIGINNLSLSSKYDNKSLLEIEKMLINNIIYAKDNGLKVRLTIEDASRTSINSLIEFYDLAIRNGADRICFADTVGILTPNETKSIVVKLKEVFKKTPLEVHFHNDRGFALANSYISHQCGADWISSSVLGIGERSGICNTFQLLANDSIDTGKKLNHTRIHEIEQVVSAFSRIKLSPNRPFFGTNSFSHISKLHKLAMKNNGKSYSFIDPKLFGGNHVFGNNPSFAEYSIMNFTSQPIIRSAAELKYHRKGPGNRYILLNNVLIPNADQYMILREIEVSSKPQPHVEFHVHDVDSFYVFLGKDENFTGLEIEVFMGNYSQVLLSPVTVFIPSGIKHKYEIIRGKGYYINHVAKGDYNKSIIEYEKF